MTDKNNNTLPGSYTPDENVKDILENGFGNSVSSPYGSIVANPSKTALLQNSKQDDINDNGHLPRRGYVQRKQAVKTLIEHSIFHGICKCGMPIRTKNGYERIRSHVVDPQANQNGSAGGAKLKGTHLCKSKWACPICSARIAFYEALKAANAAKYGVDVLGMAVLFLTMTFPHYYCDSLSEERKLLSYLKKALKGHRKWKALLKKYGYNGAISAVDITISDFNGWHAHVHEVLFVDGSIGDDAIKEIQDTLYEIWDRALEKYGWYENNKHKRLSTTNGVLVERAKDTEEVVDYVCKSVGGSLIGAINDVVYSSTGTKHAMQDHYTPFQLLDLISENTKLAGWAEDKFCEYVVATKGWHGLQWSPGLEELLNVQEEEHVEIPYAFMNTRDYKEIEDKDPDAIERHLQAVRQGNPHQAAAALGCVAYVRRVADSVTIGSNGYTIAEISLRSFQGRDDPHQYENAGYDDPNVYAPLIGKESFGDPDAYVDKITDACVLALVPALPNEKPGTIYGDYSAVGKLNIRPPDVNLVRCYEYVRTDRPDYNNREVLQSPLPVSTAYAKLNSLPAKPSQVLVNDGFDGRVRTFECWTDQTLSDDKVCVPYRDVSAWRTQEDLRWEKKKLERRERMNNGKSQAQGNGVPIGTIE